MLHHLWYEDNISKWNEFFKSSINFFNLNRKFYSGLFCKKSQNLNDIRFVSSLNMNPGEIPQI